MRAITRKVVFCILLSLFANAASAACKVGTSSKPTHPVVLVPGILGSKLCAQKAGARELVWGGKKSLWNFERLDLSGSSPEPLEACGIIDEVQVFGPLYSVEAYKPLIETFTRWGLKENTDLFIFSYDWRLSNFDNAERFKAFVNSHLPGKEFNIVAHSMGGLVSRLYMARDPSAHRVHKIIYLGTPFYGSMNTLGTLSEGWGSFKNKLAGGMDTIRRVSLSMPGMLELLPRYQSQGRAALYTDLPKGSDVIDIFNSETWKQNGWLPTPINQGVAFMQFKSNLARAKSLSTELAKPISGATEILFAGDPRETKLWMSTTKARSGYDNWKFESDQGDGTVPVWSAARSVSMSGIGGTMQSFAEHATLFDDGWVKNELDRELCTVEPITKRDISGTGYPTIQLTVDGVDREWPIKIIGVSLSDHTPLIGDNLAGETIVTFSKPLEGWKTGSYLPTATLVQGDKSTPLSVSDATSAKDSTNNKLRFSIGGNLSHAESGAAQVVVTFPQTNTPTEAREYAVIQDK